MSFIPSELLFIPVFLFSGVTFFWTAKSQCCTLVALLMLNAQDTRAQTFSQDRWLPELVDMDREQNEPTLILREKLLTCWPTQMLTNVWGWMGFVLEWWRGWWKSAPRCSPSFNQSWLTREGLGSWSLATLMFFQGWDFLCENNWQVWKEGKLELVWIVCPWLHPWAVDTNYLKE